MIATRAPAHRSLKGWLDVQRADTEIGQDAQPHMTVAADELNRFTSVVRHRERSNLDGVDRESVIGIEAVYLGQAGEALRHCGERAERQPDRCLVTRRECCNAAYVIAVLMGHDDGSDRFRRNADARQPCDSIANAEAAVDEHSCRTRLHQQAIAFAAAAETGEAHAT